MISFDRYLEHVVEDVRSMQDERLVRTVDASADLLARAIKCERTIFVAGNGGSGAQADHLVAEFVGARDFPDIVVSIYSLRYNDASLKGINNDLDATQVFSHQIKRLARPEDVLVSISTSGSSKNIVEACAMAKARQLKVVLLTGEFRGAAEVYADIVVRCPGSDVFDIQNYHMIVIHYIYQFVRDALAEV